MKTLLLILTICLSASFVYGQGTQTYNYATQTVSNTTFSYTSENYDLSGITGSQNTRFLVTTSASAAQVIGQIIVSVDGVDYTLVTQGGGTTQNLTGELNLELNNTAHTVILKLKADAASITFTTPQLIVSPTETNQLQNDITALQNSVSSLTTSLATQGTTLTGLQTDLNTLSTTIASLQSALTALDTKVSALPTTSSSGTDPETTAQLNSLTESVNSLNRQLDSISDDVDPLSPTNLGLSIGPAMAGLLGNQLIPFATGTFSTPGVPSGTDARPGYYE